MPNLFSISVAESGRQPAVSGDQRRADEFVSTVSHELRTPLTAIAASLCLLKNGGCGELPPPAARLIAIAHSNSDRLVRLVSDILDLEKIESGLNFQSEPVALKPLVEDAIDSASTLAAENGIRLRLSANSAAVTIQGDPDRLTQVVANLLSNAIKFSPSGEDVVVTITGSDGRARVVVRDHGAGVPEEFRPRIFERFAQATPRGEPRKSGTGLGLSIVKEIVNRHGGQVGFDSAPGRGALFWFELPIEDAEDKVRPKKSGIA